MTILLISFSFHSLPIRFPFPFTSTMPTMFSGWRRASQILRSRTFIGGRMWSATSRTRMWTTGCGRRSSSDATRIAFISRWSSVCATAICFPAGRWTARRRSVCSITRATRRAGRQALMRWTNTNWSTGSLRMTAGRRSERRWVIDLLFQLFNKQCLLSESLVVGSYSWNHRRSIYWDTRVQSITVNNHILINNRQSWSNGPPRLQSLSANLFKPSSKLSR